MNTKRHAIAAAYRAYRGPHKLTPAQVRTLLWIAEHGGTCTVSGDTLVAGDPSRARKRDSCVPCLHLILLGLLSTEGGVMRITPATRSHLQP